VGTIAPGKLANLIITKEISNYGFLPYAFGSHLIDKVIIQGKSL
jgi:imidazolonepropionase